MPCATVQTIWCERKYAVKTNELYVLEAESVTRELVLRFWRFICWLTELENCELSTWLQESVYVVMSKQGQR